MAVSNKSIMLFVPVPSSLKLFLLANAQQLVGRWKLRTRNHTWTLGIGSNFDSSNAGKCGSAAPSSARWFLAAFKPQ